MYFDAAVAASLWLMLSCILSAVWRDKVQILADKTVADIVRLVELDARPFTLNESTLNKLRLKFLTHLKNKRAPKLVPSTSGSESAALAALAALGYTGIVAADLKKLRPVDPFETELEVMAETRAYFQIAYTVSSDRPRRPLPALC